MNCFEMNQKYIISNFANIFKSELKETLSYDELKKFNFKEPVYLSPESIQTIIEKLNEDQKSFKKLVNAFDVLNDKNKIKILDHFCPMNSNASEKYLREIYPCYKKFKTPFIVGSHIKQRKSKAVVYAKKGVTFNPLKKYTPKEIEEMINSEKIIISHFEQYGKEYYTKNPDFFNYENNMLNIAYTPNFVNKNAEAVQTANTQKIIHTLLSSVNLSQLKNYYKQTYLTVYENCLNYLYKCTEFSDKKENENLQELQKQLENFPKKFEQNSKSKTEITKLISDKGRE